MAVKPAVVGDAYFEWTVDGTPMPPTITLTAIADMKGPSSTPTGSMAVGSGISQGSVSLQAFPAAGYTTNSFDTGAAATSVITPGAVVITAIEPAGDDVRVVTGTFQATTFSTPKRDDSRSTDHVVTGKFRIRHELTSMSGERF